MRVAHCERGAGDGGGEDGSGEGGSGEGGSGEGGTLCGRAALSAPGGFGIPAYRRKPGAVRAEIHRLHALDVREVKTEKNTGSE